MDVGARRVKFPQISSRAPPNQRHDCITICSRLEAHVSFNDSTTGTIFDRNVQYRKAVPVVATVS